jgi:DNA-binding response OmpR family regulator
MSNMQLQECVSLPESQPQRVLILEDDWDIAEVMQECFKQAGFICHHESSPEDIISLVQDHQPDLVLIDYLLPAVNGGELCSQLKAEDSTKNIPVIICSAYPRVLLSLGTYGSDAFIPKPFDIHYLLSKAEELINSKKNAAGHETSTV